MNHVNKAIVKASNKVEMIEKTLLNATDDELDLMKELAESNGATASSKDLHLEETFYNDLEELIDNIIAERLILRSMD
jgi:hypothetical protein